MTKGLKIGLDQLEAFIQLVQINDPKLKSATYKELADVITKEFGVEVNEDDLFVLYEPTFEEEVEDMSILYGSMFNSNFLRGIY